MCSDDFNYAESLRTGETIGAKLSVNEYLGMILIQQVRHGALLSSDCQLILIALNRVG